MREVLGCRRSNGLKKTLLTGLLLLAFPATASALAFQPPQEISSGLSTDPSVAVDGQNVSVVWRSPHPTEGAVCFPTHCFNDVFSRGSVDGGQSFGAKVNVSGDTDSSLDAAVATRGANVYVAWDSEPGFCCPEEIYFARSVDGGATFGLVVNLSANAGFSRYPVVAAEGSNVYVLWRDDTPGNVECFFRRSTDFGASFGPTINLSESSANGCANPSISLSLGAVYVAWPEGSKKVRVSTDGGATFGPTYTIAVPSWARVLFSGATVYAAWYEQVERSKNVPENFEVFFARSFDGGATFSPPANLSSNATQSRFPELAANGPNVYVAWQDDASTKTKIDRTADLFVRHSANEGAAFDPAVQVTDRVAYAINNPGFDLAVASANVYAVWYQRDPDASIYRVFLRRGS